MTAVGGGVVDRVVRGASLAVYIGPILEPLIYKVLEVSGRAFQRVEPLADMLAVVPVDDAFDSGAEMLVVFEVATAGSGVDGGEFTIDLLVASIRGLESPGSSA